MPPRKRGLDAVERADLWRRWREGQSLSDIARALHKPPGSVFGFVTANGGISPSTRRRSARALTVADREEISRGLSKNESIRSIAARLCRPPSTISREIGRNNGPEKYRATDADTNAWRQARRPKPCKLALHRRLQRCVAFRLSQNWSPAQISGWLKLRYWDNEHMHISHETIYRSLFIQARGVLKRELQAHLRSRRKMRRAKTASTAGQQRGQIIDAVPISARPAEIADRAIPGHWEGDLITGSKNSHIATLVERHSRYTMLVKVKAKDTESVVAAVKKQITKLPAELRKTLTWDRGTEMAQHKAFSVATNVKVYFCDPQSPWQRGTNENTNGLLRQYFPKGTELSTFSQASLNKVAHQLNERPRRTLAFRTPANALQAALR
ncbi:MAG: IS30 family transposase [Candidatus Eisenbacteria bacterium]|uniref:IS30 family transposase n=1 Tax=Eiseniibacteriota bacterium TaxID=2212470 RepID=A0A849SKN0_UNCEI|nr:IS30 family transposase [Candidatus Eisenbacteria bacterium]